MIRRMLADLVEQAVPPGPVPRGPVRRETGEASRAVNERRSVATDVEARATPRPRREAVPAEREAPGIMLDLSSPAALRRAFLLMEILGPPAALRDPTERSRF